MPLRHDQVDNTAHVLDPSDVTSLGLVGMEEYEETLRERLLADANDRLDQLVKKYSPKDISMTAITKVDKPWRGIIQEALEQQSDTIIISSHGKGMVKQMLLGSTAEKIVRKAPMTVIVVKPQHIKDKLRNYWHQIGED